MTTRLIFLLVFIATGAFAQVDYRAYIIGQWQCQSTVTTLYGSTLALGDLLFTDAGALTGEGAMLLSHPNLATEIPMTTRVAAQWQLVGNQMQLTALSGDIRSPYPLLDGIAESFKQDILSQTKVTARLVKIGKRLMLLKAVDNTEIQCVRPTSTQ